MTTKQQSSVIAEIKNWLFPGVVTIIGIFAGMMLKDIKDDLAEVKSDVKALMAQSNVDKTRIDNLERLVYKRTASMPFNEHDKELMFESFAILPNNRTTIKNKQNEEILF
jgi:hypothetical protein